MNYLLKISQRDVDEYSALADRFVFVCDLCNVQVSEYDSSAEVRAFVDGVEDELIRRAVDMIQF